MADYVLTSAAAEDLAEILEHIALESQGAAVMVQRRFEEVFELLAANPEMGHFRDDLASKPIRFFPVYSYLVIYLPHPMPLRIVRVLSSARDLGRLI